MKRIHVDEIESLPALGGELQWKPVRHELGIDAFGINAYCAEKKGELVVEEHADKHQELYLVVTGKAKFRSGEEEFEAPAGTFVLFEPEEHRVAHAAEAGTTVVAVGADAKRFEPSRWEYAFRAWGLAQLGRHDEGRRAIQEGLEQYPDSGYLLYDLACVEALAGNTDAAIEQLRKTLGQEPEFAERAREDSDFDSVRDDPRFVSLVAGEPDSGSSSA